MDILLFSLSGLRGSLFYGLCGDHLDVMIKWGLPKLIVIMIPL